MPSTKRKSPATEGKRKTRASDKSRTSIKKAGSKKKSVIVVLTFNHKCHTQYL